MPVKLFAERKRKFKDVDLPALFEGVDIESIVTPEELPDDDAPICIKLPNGTFFQEDEDDELPPGMAPVWPSAFTYVFSQPRRPTGKKQYHTYFYHIQRTLKKLPIGSEEEGYPIATLLGHYVVRTGPTSYEIAKSAYISTYIWGQAVSVFGWRKVEGINQARVIILYKWYQRRYPYNYVKASMPSRLQDLIEDPDAKPQKWKRVVQTRFNNMVKDALEERGIVLSEEDQEKN